MAKSFGRIGRNVLYAKRPEELNSKEVAKIIKKVMPLHIENVERITSCHDFYLAEQPITTRQKQAGSREILHNIVENRAYEVVQYKLGYEGCDNMQYVNVGTADKASRIDLLNTFSRLDDEQSKNLQLAEWYYSVGNAYELCYRKNIFDEDSAPYYTKVIDTREGFIVYSSIDGSVIIGGLAVEDVNDDGDTIYKLGVWSDQYYFEWTTKESDYSDIDELDTEPFSTILEGESAIAVANAANAMGATRINGIGKVPLTEYINNHKRIGYVEVAYDIYNALNTLASNRIEGIEQIVQSVLVLIGVDLPPLLDAEGKPLKGKDGQPIRKLPPATGGVLALKGATENARISAQFLSATLDQSHAQTLKEDLLRALYRIVGMPTPGNQGQAQSGGTTGQAEMMRNDWGLSDSRAKSTITLFKSAKLRSMAIRLAILRTTNGVDIGDLTLRDIDVQVTRNKFDNLLTKTQGLLNLLRAGVPELEALIAVDIYGDNNAVAMAMEEARRYASAESEPPSPPQEPIVEEVE